MLKGSLSFEVSAQKTHSIAEKTKITELIGVTYEIDFLNKGYVIRKRQTEATSSHLTDYWLLFMVKIYVRK